MASLPENIKLVLVGHRGVGKRELARRVAGRLQIELLDIEAKMQASGVEEPMTDNRGGELTRDYAASSQKGYRLRQGMLAEGLRRPGQRLIVVPPGCCVASVEGDVEMEMPWVFWVRRAGWRYEARRREGEPPRHSVWSREFEWRIQTRRPRWEARADFKFEIPWGRAPERSAQLLEGRIRVVGGAVRSPGSVRAWNVPGDRAQLGRAVRNARHIGGGVAIRQNQFSTFPLEKLRAESGTGSADTDFSVMASLGAGPIEWLRQPGVETAEIPPWRVEETLESGVLDAIDSLERVWVTGRTAGVDGAAVKALASRSAELARGTQSDVTVAPRWKPRIGAWDQLRRLLEWMRELRERWPGAEVTPVGARWVGLMPWFATRNPSFEVATGLGAWRRRWTRTTEEPAVDLQILMPTLAGSPPEHFDAVVGSDVTSRRASEWHRMAAIEADEVYGALAGETTKNPSGESLQEMMGVLSRLGVRGVAVDSPLRKRVLELDSVMNPEGLPAVNVLVRHPRGWVSRDTDHVGMASVLTEAARRGVESGTVAMIGRDDRTPAIRRAISAAMDWQLVHHADDSGWGWDAPSSVELVVNVAGDAEGVYERPPACELWVDLREDSGAPPPVAQDHMCGDCFFEAQALAARDLWQRA